MSAPKRGGLGRGLASLIPSGPTSGPRLGSAAADVIIGGPGTDKTRAAGTTPVESGGAVYREIPPSDIRPNPKQPRTVFDEEAMAELVHSIREFGLMQPIVVRERASGSYELVMGERRWRAGQEAGLETIPAIVRNTADSSMLRDALLENIHRAQLNPLEEAAAYSQLLEEFDVTHDELATRLGRSRPVVSNTIRLLRLPVAVQRRVAAGVLSAGHARALLSLEGSVATQEELAARIVAEGMSVRATEEAVVLARSREDDGDHRARVRPRRVAPEPGLEDVAERLSRSYDTRVTVSMGRRKGKIVVEFGSADDLERILTLMASGESSSG